jgi:hypothetical protein
MTDPLVEGFDQLGQTVDVLKIRRKTELLGTFDATREP